MNRYSFVQRIAFTSVLLLLILSPFVYQLVHQKFNAPDLVEILIQPIEPDRQQDGVNSEKDSIPTVQMASGQLETESEISEPETDVEPGELPVNSIVFASPAESGDEYLPTDEPIQHPDNREVNDENTEPFLHQGEVSEGVLLPGIQFELSDAQIFRLIENENAFMVASVKADTKQSHYMMDIHEDTESSEFTYISDHKGISTRFIRLDEKDVDPLKLKLWNHALLSQLKPNLFDIEFRLYFSDQYNQYLIKEQQQFLNTHNIDVEVISKSAATPVMMAQIKQHHSDPNDLIEFIEIKFQ